MSEASTGKHRQVPVTHEGVRIGTGEADWTGEGIKVTITLDQTDAAEAVLHQISQPGATTLSLAPMIRHRLNTGTVITNPGPGSSPGSAA